MYRITLTFSLIVLVFLASWALADIPRLINYQGMLTDDAGNPLNETVSITFKIYSDSLSESPELKKWEETQTGIEIVNGLFNVMLGRVTALELDFSEDYWLDITVGAEHLPSRIRLASAGYAYRALVADSALVTAPGSGSNWSVDNSVLYTNQSWGIARGDAWNALYGDKTYTMVNLGVACTTGTSGQNYEYSTVSGGWRNMAGNYATAGGGWLNRAHGYLATVGGGVSNSAGGDASTIAGGQNNSASELRATVGGGYGNSASGGDATIGGGYADTASGNYATVPGGWHNTAAGHFGFAAGHRAKALHDGSFVWADHQGTDFSSSYDNSFNVRAKNGSQFAANNDNGYGVFVENQGNGDGIRAYGHVSNGNLWAPIYANNDGTSPAICARNLGKGIAGYFQGNIEVTGTINKGALGFKIDHPLDPENKYLHHSGVESPDMMNVYNGNVVLDGKGEASVELPEWFEALNRDFRYQLTAIGSPGPNLYIAEKITGNRFKIAGGQPSAEVSWLVTGIRQDAFAEKNRIPVEEEKPVEERGKYLHPDAYNLPEAMGVNHSDKKEGRR